jgi:hypothetical protein
VERRLGSKIATTSFRLISAISEMSPRLPENEKSPEKRA